MCRDFKLGNIPFISADLVNLVSIYVVFFSETGFLYLSPYDVWAVVILF